MNDNLSRAAALEKVGRQLQANYGDRPIPGKEIVEEASRILSCPKESLIPSDYCYNCVNKDPNSMKDPMFEKVGRAKYKFLGRNYRYSGPIYWTEKGDQPRKVGEWFAGKCTLSEDPRQK